MEEIKFSIIIPHKNCPRLLQRCIDSIPQHKNIQIIVIDDNSDTDKVDFNNFPGINNPCVEIYLTKENKGAGYARNIGLKHAKGKWLIFADSDDYFSDTAFDIFNEQVNNDADIVYFSCDSIYDDTGEKANRHITYNRLINEYLNNEISKIHFCVSFDVPWAKMIKMELVSRNNIYFDEVPAANDVYFSTLSGYYAKKIDVINTSVYIVTVNIGSITKRKNYAKSFSQFHVSLRKNYFLKVNGLGSEQISIMYRYLESIKYKPYNFLYLTWLLIKYRQNPFIGYKNWIVTLTKLKKTYKMERKYYTR